MDVPITPLQEKVEAEAKKQDEKSERRKLLEKQIDYLQRYSSGALTPKEYSKLAPRNKRKYRIRFGQPKFEDDKRHDTKVNKRRIAKKNAAKKARKRNRSK